MLEKKQIKGFTLIELMVVIMIMSLLFGLGYVNLRDFQRRQVLESAVREVKGDLRYAQEMALAGRKPDNPACNNSVLHGYHLRRIDNSRYTIEAVCSAGNVQVKSVVLKDEIVMPNFGSGNTVMFKSVSGGLDQSSSITLTLTFTEAGVGNQTITISPSGEIND